MHLYWGNFPEHFAVLYVLQWQIFYALRILGSVHRRLVLRDYYAIGLSTLITSGCLAIQFSVVPILLFSFFMLLFLLQWSNVLVARFYGIKVNLHMLKTFSTGVGHFKHEFVDMLPRLLEDNKLAVFPVFVALAYSGYFLVPSPASYYLWVIFFVYFTAVVTKSKISGQSVLLWILVLVAILFLTYIIHAYLVWLIGFGALAIYSIFILKILRVNSKSNTQQMAAFYQLPTMLVEQFKDESLSIELLCAAPQLTISDEKLTQFPLQSLTPSAMHGLCRGASIIFITVESLSNVYFRKPEDRARYQPLFNKLAAQGLRSDCHISPSALTNNAFKVIYGDDYLEHFQNQGYQTCFLTSQKATEFHMDKLLAKIGYTNIIDNVSISGKLNTRLPDDKFFQASIEKLAQTIDFQKPFFLHVLNNQTHGPYFTYQQKIANRQERYYQAVLETEQTLQQWLETLRARFQLDNLLIVYTGDHGESFGEEGYTSHANAIIQPQIEVPFVVNHPKLSAKTIDFSSHFDIFPTIFDLLGATYEPEVFGQSLFQPATDPHILVYSETRMGNTPSSFGIVTPTHKIHFDRRLGLYQIRNHADEVLETLSGEKLTYYQKLLLTALQNMGILV
jgi:hypothetical protein